MITERPRGNRGVRAGRNQRRYTPRFNLYQQGLMNVAELLVNFVDCSTSRKRQNLQRQREMGDSPEEE